jgi:hypothetical protein
MGGTCPDETNWGDVQIYGNDWAFVAVDRANNRAFCWGDAGSGGKCPTGKDWRNVAIHSTLFAFVAVDRKAGAAFCWGNPDFGGDCPADVAWNTAEIYSNEFAFVALDRASQKVTCWGRDGASCPEDGVNWANADLFSTSRAFVAVDRVGNTAACWGDPAVGGHCPTDKEWRNVDIYSNGGAFVAVDRRASTAFCWGDTRFGGTCPDAKKEWRSVELYNTEWSFLAVDLETGTSFCWGDKEYGGDCPSRADWRGLSIYNTAYAFLAVDEKANNAFSWGHPSRGGSLSASCTYWGRAVVQSNRYAFVALDPMLLKLSAMELPGFLRGVQEPAACLLATMWDYLLWIAVPLLVLLFVCLVCLCRCCMSCLRDSCKDQHDTMREMALFAREDGVVQTDGALSCCGVCGRGNNEASDDGEAPVPSAGDTAPEPALGGWGLCGRRNIRRQHDDQIPDESLVDAEAGSGWCGVCKRKTPRVGLSREPTREPTGPWREPTPTGPADMGLRLPDHWHDGEDDKPYQVEEQQLLREPTNASQYSARSAGSSPRGSRSPSRERGREGKRCGCFGGRREREARRDRDRGVAEGDIWRQAHDDLDDGREDDKFAQVDEEQLTPGRYTQQYARGPPRGPPGGAGARRADGRGTDAEGTGCTNCSSGLRSLIQR